MAPAKKQEIPENWKDKYTTINVSFENAKELTKVQGLINEEFTKVQVQGFIDQFDEVLAVEDTSKDGEYSLAITTRYGAISAAHVENLKKKVANSGPGILIGKNAQAVNEFIKWNR